MVNSAALLSKQNKMETHKNSMVFLISRTINFIVQNNKFFDEIPKIGQPASYCLTVLTLFIITIKGFFADMFHHPHRNVFVRKLFSAQYELFQTGKESNNDLLCTLHILT